MAGWLAVGKPAVMAGITFSRKRIRMIKTSTNESGGVEVTGFTGCIGHDMRTGFGCCHNALTQCVATVTRFRCAFENTSDVAGFASGCGMSTGEWKPCRHVVEVASTQLSFGHGLK
jgi:hypothetical protein